MLVDQGFGILNLLCQVRRLSLPFKPMFCGRNMIITRAVFAQSEIKYVNEENFDKPLLCQNRTFKTSTAENPLIGLTARLPTN